MVGDSAVEEDWVGGVDNLGEDEGLVLTARSERCFSSGVAQGERIRLGNGMHVCVPHELDGITDCCVNCERYVAEDTL